MKDFSKEVIEIDGVEYTLFLNRKGIVAWEKFTRADHEKGAEIAKIYEDIEKGEVVEIKDDTDPFAGLEAFDEVDNVEDALYEKLFWIMLRPNHNLSFEEAKKLYKRAKEIYKGHQVVDLCEQMMNDANVNKFDEADGKKLKALRPTK